MPTISEIPPATILSPESFSLYDLAPSALWKEFYELSKDSLATFNGTTLCAYNNKEEPKRSSNIYELLCVISSIEKGMPKKG